MRKEEGVMTKFFLKAEKEIKRRLPRVDSFSLRAH